MLDGFMSDRLPVEALDVAAPPEPTVFHEAWLLDAASDGAVEFVEVLDQGRVVGRLPFIRRRSLGVTLITQPRLIHLLGPVIDDGRGSSVTRALKRNRILSELLGKLPAASGFSQKIHGGLSDVVAFQEAGYEIKVELTYNVQPAPDAQIWKGMRDKTRNVIRRAQEQLEIRTIENHSEFADFYYENLSDRKQRSYYPPHQVNAVCREAMARGRGQALGAYDSSGQLCAAIFMLKDEHVTYYYMSTRRQEAHNGAISLLIWTGIRSAAGEGHTFDFDGFSSNGNSLFYAGFGGQIAARYIASRSSPFFRMCKLVGEIV
jgi:hypothetical protein